MVAATMPATAVPTPIKISPEQIKASHAAQAAEVGGAADEAQLDIAKLLSATDKLERDNVRTFIFGSHALYTHASMRRPLPSSST